MKRIKRLVGVCLLALALCGVGVVWTQARFARDRSSELDAEGVLFRAIGVFRVFAVDALWVRMSTHQRAGRDDLVLSDARALLKLEPHSEKIRDFLHWHLAFNMANRALDEASEAQWFELGLDIQEEGLRRNPESVTLNRGLGMTLFMISDRQGPKRRVCHERYGVSPEQLAWSHLERSYQGRPEPRVLLFLIQALENGAAAEMALGADRQAERLWTKALRRSDKDLRALLGDEEVAEMVAYYQKKTQECRRNVESDED